MTPSHWEVPVPSDPPTCQPRTSPSHLLIFQPTLMYLFTCLWVVQLVLKQIPFPPPPPHTGRSRPYLFIRFQEPAKADRLFCTFCPQYERGRKGSRVGTWEEKIIQRRKSPLVGPQDHLTCGFYSWPHNVCVGGGYYLFADSASPYSLTPQRHYSGQI